MTVDWIFVLHNDFLDRTEGAGRPSIPNSASGLHEASPYETLQVLSRLCGPQSVACAKEAVQSQKPRGAENPRIALLVELARRDAVRNLVNALSQLLIPQSSSPLTGKAKNVSDVGPQLSQHNVAELVTSLVLQERNDPYCDDTFRRWFAQEKEEETSDSTSLSHVSSQDVPTTTTRNQPTLRPYLYQRRRVLPCKEDLGSVLLYGPQQVPHRVTAIVNPWCVRAQICSDALSSSPSASGSTNHSLGGEPTSLDVEIELRECTLATSKACVLDVPLPNPELQERVVARSLFQRLLVWGGQDKAWATQCADRITELCQDVRNRLHQRVQTSVYTTTTTNSAIISSSSWRVDVRHETKNVSGETVRTVELHFHAGDSNNEAQTGKEQWHPVSTALLESSWLKLRSLYDLHRSPSHSDKTNRQETTNDQEEQEFACRVLTLMARYASLSGGVTEFAHQTSGFHASVPTQVYALARTHLSTVAECFASPMNVSSPLFCSLFPDCDSYFGSMGSFFDLSIAKQFPNGIAMNCNPPFTLAIMSRVPGKLQALCEEGDALTVPVQFLIVVCNWAVVAGVEQAHGRRILTDLAKSVFCRRHVSVAPEHAPYQDGHAFALCRPFFTLKSNTEVYLWQNHTAAGRWKDHSGASCFDAVLEGWSGLQVRSKRSR